jgi:HEPN domain-containing protein
MKKEILVANPEVMPEVVNSLMQFIMRYTPDKKMITLADDLLKCAKTDLAACKILYKERLFSQSTYHLQQAAEKASKVMFLNFGMFSKKDMRNISHNSLNGYLMLIDKMADYVGKIKKMYPDLKTDTADAQSISKDEKKRMELALTNYKGIKAMLKVFDDIKTAFKEKLNDVEGLLSPYSISKSLKNASKDTTFDSANKLLKGKSNSQILKKYYNPDSSMNFLYDSLDFCMLFIIASLTFPHEEYTRYPDKEIKPTNYTKNMGIVKATPEIITHLERIIKNMEKTYG